MNKDYFKDMHGNDKRWFTNGRNEPSPCWNISWGGVHPKISQYKAGQLVRAKRSGTLAAIRWNQFALVIETNDGFYPSKIWDTFIRVMWPDGLVEDLFEDELSPCKISQEGL